MNSVYSLLAAILRIAPTSRSRASAGMAFGAAMPRQAPSFQSLPVAAFKVGTFGYSAAGVSFITARLLTLPASISERASGSEHGTTSTPPATRSCSPGAAPGLQDLVAGGVEVVPCSLPEARSLIDAGKVRSLAIMADAPAALYPNVPTLKAATGSDWKLGAWRGIAAPKGLPAEARDKLVGAIRKIAASKDYTEFMASRGFGVTYQGPDDFAKFMAKADTDLGATMKAVGIAK